MFGALFPSYLLLYLFLSTLWAFRAASILACLVPGPDACWTILRDSYTPLRDHRKNEYAPARFALVGGGRRNEEQKKKKQWRKAKIGPLELVSPSGTRDYPY